MNRHHLIWSIVVFGIVAVAYGLSSLIYSFNAGKGLSVASLILLIAGVIALLFFFFGYTYSKIQNKNKKKEAPVKTEKVVEEKPAEEKKEEVTPQKDKVEEVKKEVTPTKKKQTSKSTSNGSNKSYYDSPEYQQIYNDFNSRFTYPTFVKKVGYGLILRVSGDRILDMRNNDYYRIEGDYVKQEGYGPVYEIRGNQIRDAFGSYLYEISGSNINKIYGGFFASISGNYITLYDGSEKYEMGDSLSKKQLLVVVALLFRR